MCSWCVGCVASRDFAWLQTKLSSPTSFGVIIVVVVVVGCNLLVIAVDMTTDTTCDLGYGKSVCSSV